MRRPAATATRRRMLLLALPLAAAALLASAQPALAGALAPESGGSPNADDISTLYKLTLYIAIVIFAGVEGTLIYSLVKYRARPGAPPAQQIRGNTPLEIGWTIGAALILVVLTTVTFVYLGDIKDPPRSGPGGLPTAGGAQLASIDQPAPPGGEALEIAVNGQQYLWRYDYPPDGAPGKVDPGRVNVFSYHEMVVPTNTTVTLRITSSDVAHAWWIPKLGGKFDAIPGHTNETWLKISQPGVYEGQCAELCGDNHADMRARVRAVSVDQYLAWAAARKREIEEAQALLAAARKQREAPPPQ